MAIDSTSLDLIRLYASDTNTTNPIWEDSEIDILWADNGNDVRNTAATLLEIAAGDSAKIAVLSQRGTFTYDLSKIPELLLKTAARLRDQGTSFGIVVSNDQIFSMDSGDGSTVGTMTGW
jgi:hypothetical protein